MSVLTFAHGIVSHSTTTGIPGDPQNFLIINGNKVDLHAPLDQPFVFTIAQRTTNYLFTTQAAGDIQAWGYGTTSGTNATFDNIKGGGAATNEYYLWIDINRATGVTTYGHTKVEPATGSTPPFANVERPNDLHWFDTSTKTLKVWKASGVGPAYGKWVEYVRFVVAKYTYSVGFSSLSINSPSFLGTTAGLVGSTRAGALIYDSTGMPVKRTTSSNVTLFFTTDDVFTSGLPSLASPVAGNRARYETFLVDAIGLMPAGAYTMVRFTDFNEVLPLEALAQPNDLFGMIEFPIGASGDLVQVTLSGVVNNPNWTWSTVGQQIFVDKDNDGLLVTVEDDNYVPLANQLPVAVALTKTSVLLRVPELKLTVGAGTGATSHGDLTDLAADDHLQYLPVSGSRGMSGNLSMSLNNIVSVGTVDGRDVSVDGSTLDSHVADTTIHFTQGSPIGSDIPHGNLLNVGTNTHTDIDAHIANTAIHIGSPITISHTILQDIGTNTHTQIDSHISDTSIHQPLTVEDVLGSPITSVGNVNTIQFNKTSGFDVVDQTGGVVRIDFNSAFNPIIVEGGSPVQTLTASGEEPLKLIAGANITLTGNAGASPKTITIASAGGGGGGSPVFIPSLITDADGDTYIRVEQSADEDVIRISTGDTPSGFFTQTNIMVLSSAEWTVNMGAGQGGSPTTGAQISLTAGQASGAVPGGNVSLYGGYTDATQAGQVIVEGGGVTSNAAGGVRLLGGDGSDPSYNGGKIDIFAGPSGSSTTNGGNINITGGLGGSSTGYGGTINIVSGEGYTPGDIIISAAASSSNGEEGGNVNIIAGNSFVGSPQSGKGGSINITAGIGSKSGSYEGGNINITAGNAYYGGNIVLKPGMIGTNTSYHGAVIIQGNDDYTGEMLFYDVANDYVGFKAPVSISSSVVWTLPDEDGSFGQILTTNGSGILSWTTSSGGAGSPDITARKYTEIVNFTGSPLTETITHNLGEKYVVVQLYDSNDEQIGADTIKLIDVNSLEITVNTTLTGVTVVVIG